MTTNDDPTTVATAGSSRVDCGINQDGTSARAASSSRQSAANTAPDDNDGIITRGGESDNTIWSHALVSAARSIDSHAVSRLRVRPANRSDASTDHPNDRTFSVSLSFNHRINFRLAVAHAASPVKRFDCKRWPTARAAWVLHAQRRAASAWIFKRTCLYTAARRSQLEQLGQPVCQAQSLHPPSAKPSRWHCPQGSCRCAPATRRTWRQDQVFPRPVADPPPWS